MKVEDKQVMEFKSKAGLSKTRSQPADKDDPYKLDLLEEQLVAKYEKMLAKDRQEGDKKQENLTNEHTKKELYIASVPSATAQKDNNDVLNLLKGLDPDMDADLLAQIMQQVNSIPKQI